MKVFWSAFIAAWLLLGASGESLGQALPKTYTNSLGLEFTLIPSGKFTMGPGPAFLGPPPEGLKRREVTIKKPFYMSITEINQSQWFALTGKKPSYRKGDKNPVENVTYHDAVLALEELSRKEGRGEYRLPTEAEWEYAARAGTSGNYFFGDSSDPLKSYAWFGENLSTGGHHPVASKAPSPFGLFDIYGNVYEWTSDIYDESGASKAPAEKTKDLPLGSMMVIKGGCYSNLAEDMQSASRFMELPETRSMFIGVRVVLVPEPK
jgi:formylglycine-generating enzyme required for sulfatase activity